LRREWNRKLGRSTDVYRMEVQYDWRDCSLQVGLRVWLGICRTRGWMHIPFKGRYLKLHLGSGRTGIAHARMRLQHGEELRCLPFEERSVEVPVNFGIADRFDNMLSNRDCTCHIPTFRESTKLGQTMLHRWKQPLAFPAGTVTWWLGAQFLSKAEWPGLSNLSLVASCLVKLWKPIELFFLRTSGQMSAHHMVCYVAHNTYSVR